MSQVSDLHEEGGDASGRCSWLQGVARLTRWDPDMVRR